MEVTPEKKALIVAYYYPPANNGGTQRPYSFAKYLPLFGYQPLVLTVRTEEMQKNEVNILRINDPALEITKKRTIHSFLFRAIRKLAFVSGFFPGNLHWWYKEASSQIDAIIREHLPDIIFATFPPHETLMLGMKAAKKYNIPLVLDFRDGMVFESLEKRNILSAWRQKRLEKKLLENSVHVTTVSEPISTYFGNKYTENSVTTITNGFDPAEWDGVDKMLLGDKINIVYTGRLSKSRRGTSVSSFLSAISSLSKSQKDEIMLHMVGDFNRDEKEAMLDSLTNTMVKFHGFVTRKEAIQFQRSSDLLLLVTLTGQESLATGKIFEYLAASRPILALTEGTAAEDIVKRTGSGICVNPNDTEKIASQLKTIIDTYPNLDFYKPNKNEIEKFNRITLTQQLAHIFDQVLMNQ